MIGRLKDVSARTKILLFALLFIILPSGVLGYLGFRSIGNRGLILQENYRSMARLLRDELQAEVAGLEGRFAREMLEQDWNQDAREVRTLLARVGKRHPAIGEVFVLGADGSLVHPDFYLEPEVRRQAGQDRTSVPRSSLIERGERYELADLDLRSAARYYGEAVRLAATPESRSYARLLLGRCYFKMRDYAGAAEQYRILSEQDDGARSSDSTPLRIIGLFRLAETFGLMGRADDEAHTDLALFEELSLGPADFESREFYLESVRAGLEDISKRGVLGETERERLASLETKATARAETEGRLKEARQALMARSDVGTSSKGPPDSERSLMPISHLTVRGREGKPYRLGYVALAAGEGLAARSVLAFAFDEAYVLNELFPRLAGEQAAGDDVRPAILGESGPLTIVAKAPTPTQPLAVESLSEYFPGWSLALFDSRGKSIDQLVSGEMRWYAAVLLGIAVLIVAGIVMTLQAATHEAETVRLRSDFVSNVSHELKTPLSLIRLFGETMESERWTDDTKRREFSRIIARESRRLSHLIDNVLDFSKIDSGRKQYRFEKGNLVEVVAETVEAYRFYVQDQGFTYDVSLPPGPVVVSMDKDAIAQALLNLLNNAEKYSGERKHIGVRMELDASQARITVEDEGSGIAPTEVKHVFDKFYRARSRPAGEAQGCGLGLTIVKNTVESHGGTVSVESEPGRGSRFTITLPLEDREQRPGGSSEGANG
jgi:signal transduction histidine kinase